MQLGETTEVINEHDYDLRLWKNVDTSHFLLYGCRNCDME